MKQLSSWGKKNMPLARAIITLSFFILVVLGSITGILLSKIGIGFSELFYVSIVLLFGIVLFVYPAKSIKARLGANRFYWRQKICDFGLAFVVFCMVMYFGNQPNRVFRQYAVEAATILPKDSTQPYLSIENFSNSLKNESGQPLKWKEKKVLLKKQIRAIKQAEELSAAAKTVLIILSIVAALGLLYLVAALACNISCNGSVAGAAIVAGLGTGLIIFLFLLTIKAITGRKRKKKAALAPDAPSTNGT